MEIWSYGNDGNKKSKTNNGVKKARNKILFLWAFLARF